MTGRLIASGQEYGSLQVADPMLCAEVFLLLLNFLVNPVLFSRSSTQTRQRLDYLRTLLCQMGLDIVDEEFISLIMDAYKKMNAFSVRTTLK